MYIQNPEKFIKDNKIETLDEIKAKEIYDKLVENLNHFNYLYYVQSQPVISDYEYDLLFHYLENLESKFQNLIRKDSPIQRLTNQIQSDLKKAKHKYLLLSLENTYNVDEVGEKLEKIEKDVWEENINFYIEPKYDGLSVELIYENGFLIQWITRWNGEIWEDITENIKTIKSIPLSISYKNKLHVRGEVVVKKSIFEKINKEREKQWLETYSNPRNLASGSLRQLDVSITRSRQLDMVVYEILNFKDTWVETHHKSLDFLEKQWFWVFDFKSIVNNWELKINNWELFKHRHWLQKEEILEIVNSEEIKNILDEKDVEFDGLVIKVDNDKYWNMLWETAHHPKWAFAYKYPAKQISTQILDVELSVWRTWVITPVAVLQPIDFSGVIVSRASLQNFDFIKEKDIKIWDYVWVQRSGEVIPYIIWVIKERRENDNIIENDFDKIKKISWDYKNSYLNYLLKYNLIENNKNSLIDIQEPTYCPVCDGETLHLEWEVALKCINVSCPAQVKEKIAYFVSKNWLDIDGMWIEIISSLLQAKIIYDYGDIFYLEEKKQELLVLPLFKEKKVNNLLFSINQKRKISLNVFLSALWVELLWKKTSKLIAWEIEKEKIMKQVIDFGEISDFLVSEEWEEFLLWINGVWPKVVQSIKKFFHEKHNQKVIKKILQKVEIITLNNKNSKFSGEQFVITGSVEWVSRDKIEKFIEENGGEFSNQLTKETTLLLIWDKAWNSKIKKAQENNILTKELKSWLQENWRSFDKKTIKEESLF